MVRGDVTQVQFEKEVFLDVAEPGPARRTDDADRRVEDAARDQTVLDRADISQNGVGRRFVR